MTLKISNMDVIKGALGAVIAYVLYNLNQPILEGLLLSGMSITWISFLLGLYNISATGGIIIVNKILGTITPEMANEARKTGEEVNKIATTMPEENPLANNVKEAKENLKETGSIYGEKEEEEPIEEPVAPIVEIVPEVIPEPTPEATTPEVVTDVP